MLRKGLVVFVTVCVLALFGIIAVGCTGSSSSNGTTGNTSTGSSITYQTITHDGYSFEVNSTWVETAPADGLYVYRPAGQDEGYPVLTIIEFNSAFPKTTLSSQMAALKDSCSSSTLDEDTLEYSNLKEGTFGSNALLTADVTYTKSGSAVDKAKVTAFYLSPSVRVEMAYYADAADYDTYKSDAEHVSASLTYTGTPTVASDSMPEYPTPVSDPNFWSRKPIPFASATMTVQDVLDKFDEKGVAYVDVRVYLYLDKSGVWADATDIIDPSEYGWLKASGVDADANGVVLIQLAG